MNYVAGIDGGGTRTQVVVSTEKGEVIQTLSVGPLNYNGQEEATVTATLIGLAERIGQAITSNGGEALASCRVICIGAAGISHPRVAGWLEDTLRAAGYEGELMLVGDHETALYGAHGGEAGVILIAGTGSICYGRNGTGATHRAGGYGHLIDDSGSGYSIGRDLLAAVVQAADGRCSPTLITELVYDQLAITTVEALVGYVYDSGRTKKDIAALAPLLTIACEAGDTQALEIAQASAAGLVPLVRAVADRLDLQTGPLAMLGSVLTVNRFVREAFTNQLASVLPGLAVVPQQQDAAHGAAIMALERLRRGGNLG
ncbi:N-acetylglucosamine kinase [Paenibacillus daejeonensis]|uniref:N-acetylglucosamine kinase n=1 Tax=Paenibacillus daejeonensis TaxID=135193 RepID=UPI0003601764|nr:BadF/BadG/BcrA/BcrD ATPase family protein [Paenibacillus daejeonensis]